MNKKGFTVVELAVSFVLVSTISIMLFQLIFSLKELYVSGDIKTTLLNKQGIMIKKIYDDLNTRELQSITSCGVSCLTFTYADHSEAMLLIDVAAGTLTYDDYVMKLSEGSTFGQVSFTNFYEEHEASAKTSIFSIDIPIKSKFLEDDFGIHIVKLYNENEITINKTISVEDATIVANTIPMRLTTIDEREIINSSDNHLLDEVKDSDAIFAHIFMQKNGSYFPTYESFLKYNSPEDINKFSSLKSLEVFRSDRRTNFLKQEFIAIDDKKNEEEIGKIFQDGYFELILDYPGISAGVGELQNYNFFIQTNNFTNSKVTGYRVLDNIYTGSNNNFGGLYYWKGKTDIGSYVTGATDGTNFKIGINKEMTNLIGPSTTTVPEVDIWVRVDEYISKYALSTVTTD